MSDRTDTIHDRARRGNVSDVVAELNNGADLEARDPSTQRTVLMEAAFSSAAKVDLIELLIERGANVNAFATTGRAFLTNEQLQQLEKLTKGVDPGETSNFERLKNILVTAQSGSEELGHLPTETVLSCAIHGGDVEKVRTLLEAGADIHYSLAHGYDALINAVHGSAPSQLLPMLQLLVDRGAGLNSISEYSESALSVTSNRGRFDAVAFLLAAGADPAPLEWTPLMRSIALGSLQDVTTELMNADLSARDFWSRTPWLLSLQSGDISRLNCCSILAPTGVTAAAAGRRH